MRGDLSRFSASSTKNIDASPAKSNVSGKTGVSKSPNRRNKSKSVTKHMGIGKSRRKQLREQKDKALREGVIRKIQKERSISKAEKREQNIKNMLPPSLRVKAKGFEPKDPLSPTRHRAAQCEPNLKNMPLKKSAKKWSNNYSKQHKRENQKSSRRQRILDDDRRRS
jgi:hypothetical protein